MHIQHIPLTKLTLSKLNVRKSGAANGLEELVASIAAHGLLQNLSVRALSKQKFEVVAGGRRVTRDVRVPGRTVGVTRESDGRRRSWRTHRVANGNCLSQHRFSGASDPSSGRTAR